ncbi:monofunctional biosynthetic peptidoglycan transglycosylase [Celeribacter indicus]|uniref:Biosynthetic peptidoglycan transglycosylase n=1 Tax=Celeribacter indicus TaxID=1208324 RepID=A0A0B5DW87_9RHOB|nr:monofunctional biosynthetic peptidoglycan transglycosylase [Celeribacter indicus]AJE45006.1 monofunctional biosynthetic peptidoglycan transglycosylase [Celeribacter indicus]SDW94955.1 monofunctional biosynthetic peptidoglycan transglycosylase [Celeribacter indicus]
MAKRAKTQTAKKRRGSRGGALLRRGLRLLFLLVLLGLLWILSYSVIAPWRTPYMLAEAIRHRESVDYRWVPMERISPHLARAVVAAEDANFCRHWGFDLDAIRQAIAAGGSRGASTISQQTVKNAFLWHGRSWPRKALEALITPVVELTWSKRRILEVYLNVAEFDTGVFGAEAAARHYFGIGPEALSARQAAQLAAVLPAPKDRDAGNPGHFVRRRAAQIVDGAATIARDGRAACFEH